MGPSRPCCLERYLLKGIGARIAATRTASWAAGGAQLCRLRCAGGREADSLSYFGPRSLLSRSSADRASRRRVSDDPAIRDAAVLCPCSGPAATQKHRDRSLSKRLACSIRNTHPSSHLMLRVCGEHQCCYPDKVFTGRVKGTPLFSGAADVLRGEKGSCLKFTQMVRKRNMGGGVHTH